ncbi:MAG: type II toxin-antitoxin system prevent-host-death family antitoxin [Asticcacaulis sp.]|uniref:type II toxin-antitoxin system prevent-host-death family antitoxin n=1 Tax=Asticcacaulis sp. TaxID=1872648 RepID=UPI003F7BCCB5
MPAMSSRDFNQDVAKAKRAAREEPVFVTDRGKPTHVLMSFDAFCRLSGQGESILDLLALDDGAQVDLEASSLGAGWDRREAFR